VPRVILASSSPRRRTLLATLGIPFEVIPSGIDEPLLPGVAPADLAVRLALAKARDVAGRAGPAVVLGADTLVVLDGRALGKPESRADARAMLAALAGRTHEVVTAVAVIGLDAAAHVATVASRVVMRAYSPAEIEAYVATGESDDKAGGYAVQGDGGHLVARVEGCYTNVVGLPVGAVTRLLRKAGVTVPRPPRTEAQSP
jgi:septum formation protein